MSDRRGAKSPKLDDVLDDLQSVAESVRDRSPSADVDDVRGDQDTELVFPFADYMAFLAELDCIEWRRARGHVNAGEALDEPLERPESWRDEVHFEFADRLANKETSQTAESATAGTGGRSRSGNRASASNRTESNRSKSEKKTSRSRTSERGSSQSTTNKQTRRNESDEMARTASSRDRYEREDEIGTGGLGTVYKGRHRPLDRPVAIKEISSIFDVFADLQRDEIIDRFRDITRAQAQISHPAVAQIYDLDTEGEYPFVVTEYAPNGSLRRLIENDDARTLRVALKYFIQLLHGLNAAHRQDLVHGNIKPENVLLDSSGNAKLSDFGLSTLVDLEGASDQVYVGVGAVAYMAPEQFQNPNAATKRSDIYALGILFYEMLTGKVPGRRSPMPSSFYSEIPRSLDDIFDRMTMDGEEDRFESVAEILEAFYESEEIVELLDRESGVVFFRDPIEYGDSPFAGEETPPLGASRESDDRDGSAEEVEAGADTVQTDAAPVDEVDAAEEGLDEDSSEAEGLDEDSSEAEGLDEDSSDAEGLDEDSSDAEGLDEDSSEVEDEGEDADEEDDEESDAEAEGEGEDDEVLDKIDEYGEMFEE